jgi:phage baseplate assembly protein W
MAPKPPFYGTGVLFPARLNNRGDFAIGEGSIHEDLSNLEIMAEAADIGQLYRNGLIRGEMAHILLCRIGEHDTLPEFGSRLHMILYSGNTKLTQVQAEVYLSIATERWEKRLTIPDEEGVRWGATGEEIDEGKLHCLIMPHWSQKQTEKNLVTPYVTCRAARLAEYPTAQVDRDGHDYDSRYYRAQVFERDGIRALRLPRKRREFPPASDDHFHEVGPLGASWLSLAHQYYGDVRLWHVIAEAYQSDAATEALGRDYMDTTGDAPAGETIRIPSPTRALMQLSE